MKPRRTLLVLTAAALLAASLPGGIAGRRPRLGPGRRREGRGRHHPDRPRPQPPHLPRRWARIDAGVFEILAVLDDISHFTDWMADCKERPGS